MHLPAMTTALTLTLLICGLLHKQVTQWYTLCKVQHQQDNYNYLQLPQTLLHHLLVVQQLAQNILQNHLVYI